MKAFALLTFVMLLYGCSSNAQQAPKDLLVDPSWPRQVKKVDVDWVVLENNDKAYVALSYPDSLLLRVWLEDIKRYIMDSNNMICYYRTHLKEPKCLPTQKTN